MAQPDRELLEALSGMLVQALKTSIGPAKEEARASLRNSAETAATSQPKAPPFVMHEYRSADGTSVADYFNRFVWALWLSPPHDNHKMCHTPICERRSNRTEMRRKISLCKA
uniref:Uncharacterized protein n=1 Tax=Anopheles christyi TaxID=43041 RepID=A0A182KGG9_9DIPT